jgi:hypothetical protein
VRIRRCEDAKLRPRRKACPLDELAPVDVERCERVGLPSGAV